MMMSTDSADIALSRFGCVGPAEDTYAVIERKGDEVLSFESVTNADAGTMRDEADVDWPTFRDGEASNLAVWSGWGSQKRQALYRQVRDREI